MTRSLPYGRLVGKMNFMTLVRVGMAPRAAGLTPAECQTHWRTAHADAARSLPGLRGYVQNHAVLRDGEPLLPYPGFDVCAETEFDDLAAWTPRSPASSTRARSSRTS